MTNLLSLAERVEQASEEDQRHMIEQAAALLALHRLWPPRADDTALVARFFAFLNVGAFLSAAMTLLGEGRVILNIAEDGITTAIVDGTEATADVPALALTAASLRVHALSLSGNQP